jgi:hypothetical protein
MDPVVTIPTQRTSSGVSKKIAANFNGSTIDDIHLRIDSLRMGVSIFGKRLIHNRCCFSLGRHRSCPIEALVIRSLELRESIADEEQQGKFNYITKKINDFYQDTDAELVTNKCILTRIFCSVREFFQQFSNGFGVPTRRQWENDCWTPLNCDKNDRADRKSTIMRGCVW